MLSQYLKTVNKSIFKYIKTNCQALIIDIALNLGNPFFQCALQKQIRRISLYLLYHFPIYNGLYNIRYILSFARFVLRCARLPKEGGYNGNRSFIDHLNFSGEVFTLLEKNFNLCGYPENGNAPTRSVYVHFIIPPRNCCNHCLLLK